MQMMRRENNPLAWLFDTGETIVSNAVMPWIDDASGNEEKNVLTSSML